MVEELLSDRVLISDGADLTGLSLQQQPRSPSASSRLKKEGTTGGASAAAGAAEESESNSGDKPTQVSYSVPRADASSVPQVDNSCLFSAIIFMKSCKLALSVVRGNTNLHFLFSLRCSTCSKPPCPPGIFPRYAFSSLVSQTGCSVVQSCRCSVFSPSGPILNAVNTLQVFGMSPALAPMWGLRNNARILGYFNQLVSLVFVIMFRTNVSCVSVLFTSHFPTR